jgi:hypothetical protein
MPNAESWSLCLCRRRRNFALAVKSVNRSVPAAEWLPSLLKGCLASLTAPVRVRASLSPHRRRQISALPASGLNRKIERVVHRDLGPSIATFEIVPEPGPLVGQNGGRALCNW